MKFRELFEGEVINLADAKAKREKPSFGSSDKLRFKQIHHSDVVDYIKRMGHGEVSDEISKNAKGSLRFFVHKIMKNDVHSGYMAHFTHSDASGKEYDATHAWDLSGRKLQAKRVPIRAENK